MPNNQSKYGCNAKIDIETLKYVAGELLLISSDCGTLYSEESLAISVDTISHIGDNGSHFPRVALLHAANDVIAHGATPKWATIAFSFPDATPREHIRKASENMLSVLSDNAIQALNMHTGHYGEENITLTIIGTMPLALQQSQDSIIFLSKKLGGLNIFLEKGDARLMNESNFKYIDFIKRFCTESTTDISGYGLVNHLYHSGIETQFDITLESTQLKSALESNYSSTIFCSKTLSNTNPEIVRFSDSSLDDGFKLSMYAGETNGPLALFVPVHLERKALEFAKEKSLPLIKIGKSTSTNSPNKIRIE